MTDYASLQIEHHGPVSEVVLTGPGKGNAMGPDFWREAPLAFAELDARAETRVVLLRGAGKNFCYGLDLMAMAGDLAPLLGEPQIAPGRTDFYELVLRMQRAPGAVAACKKPVVAAVQGHCIGAGLDVIAACDVRVCSADASFSLREVKVAMVADMGSLQRLPALIGEGPTRHLALTGADIPAADALRLGLVTAVYDDHDTLLEKARALANEIAHNPPLVVQGIKRVMNQRIAAEQATGLDYVAVWNAAFLQSEDLQEAIAAFAERRPPAFKGR